MRTIRRRRIVLCAVVGLVYGWCLFFVGFIASGAGEGINGPIMTSFAPITLMLGPLHDRFGMQAENILIPCMPFFWMLIGGLLGAASNRKCQRALILLLLIHYISAAGCGMSKYVEWRPGWGLQKLGPQLVRQTVAFEIIAIAIYIAGQIAIWWTLLDRKR